MVLLLSGCSNIGNKAASMSLIYGVAAVLSVLLFVSCCLIIRKKDPWYLLLFASIAVVNIGYFALSVSQSLEAALFANRLSYLGSVFLPLSMLMIILGATHIRCRRWLTGVLLGLAAVVFLVAASPGYLPIYYKEVSFEIVKGVATLKKVYGPLHVLYLIYLLGYFTAMMVTIIRATVKDLIDSLTYAVILAIAVFVNIGVWLIEQMVDVPFEMLSLSYIISECFLLGLHMLKAEAEKLKNQVSVPRSPEPLPPRDPEAVNLFREGLARLTPKEKEIYECYVAGMTTDVIMEKLSIKENTLKFHNKNLYGKLGVTSRKQLLQIHKQL